MKQFKIHHKRGITDMTSEIPNFDEWGCTRYAFPDVTREIYEADPVGYAERVRQKNLEYTLDLLRSGKFGEEYDITFNYTPIEGFDKHEGLAFETHGLFIPGAYTQTGINLPPQSYHYHKPKDCFMAKIKNTSGQDAFDHLLGITEKGQSNYITGMEKQGQAQLVNSDQMPRSINFLKDITAMDAYQKLGFTFVPNEKGEVFVSSKGDDLFVDVILPEGWKKQGSDHDMWSYVLDEKGRVRINVFYEAAFYDRRADADLNCRFSITTDTVTADGSSGSELPYKEREKLDMIGIVMDVEKVIWKSEPIKPMEGSWNQNDLARNEAEQWINKNFPDYKDPFAYWDIELLA